MCSRGYEPVVMYDAPPYAKYGERQTTTSISRTRRAGGDGSCVCKALLDTENHTLDPLHAQRRPTSEANNFGFYYPLLCHKVTNAFFRADEDDECEIDARFLEGRMEGKVAGKLFKADGKGITVEELAAMKRITFDETTGKKQGGVYYETFKRNLRKRLRSTHRIKQLLRMAMNEIEALDTRRAKSEAAHRPTCTPNVRKAFERLISNAQHLYDVGEVYTEIGLDSRKLMKYIAARGTNFTETINSLFPIMFRGGNQSMILAIAIMLSALTIFNADRRRSAGVELDYGHHDRLLVDEVNELHVKMMGVPRYGGGDDQRVRFQLRPMLPDSGARFGAVAAFSVPTTNKKPGTGASGAELADGDELAGQEGAADAGAVVPAAQKTKDADKKAADQKSKGGPDSTVRQVFGPEYAAGVVQVNAVGVTKELWQTIGRQWLRACRGTAVCVFRS